MERDWVRLGTKLREARKLMGLSQTDVAKAIGATRTPIQAIERGDERSKPTGTQRSYARLVRWTDDSIDAVLAGGEPTQVSAAPEPADLPTPAAVQEFPLRIVEALKGSGPLLDAQVMDLSLMGTEVEMIVVVRGKHTNASKDEIRRALRAWESAQPKLRNLSNEGDEPSLQDEA
jgi:DNA-binding XRE family transcriptional regulator